MYNITFCFQKYFQGRPKRRPVICLRLFRYLIDKKQTKEKMNDIAKSMLANEPKKQSPLETNQIRFIQPK